MDKFQIVDTIAPPGTDQRRALLSHLLASEGLPGVEEIAKLRADVDSSYSEGYEAGFYEGYDTGSGGGYERGYEQGLNDGLAVNLRAQQLRQALASTRQARLSELLEAEARERVEIETDRAWECYGGFVVWKDDDTFTLDWDFLVPEDVFSAEQIENFGWSCFAALAEKRKRESGGATSDTVH